MSRPRTLIVVIVLVACAALPATAAAAPGQLTQLTGLDGCWSDTGDVGAGAGLCRDAEALEDPIDVTVSPDGRNVYVGALNAVLVFSRNTQTGALTQLSGTAGCVEQPGTPDNCAAGRGVDGVRGVVVSPDGKHVYAASFDDDAIAVFERNQTNGALTQPAGTAGCIQETGAEGCADGKALDTLRGVSISPDGNNVYAANEFDEAVVALRRNAGTGALTQLADEAGCVSDTGRSDALDAGTAGECADAEGRLGDPFWTAVSPDGENVYSASDGNLIVNFRRNASTGALTIPAGSAGCVSDTGASGCADGTGLQDPRSIEVSPDNRHVYSGQIASESIASFSRNLSGGALTQLSDSAACTNDDGDEGCADGRALGDAWGVAIPRDGLNVYIATDDGNAVAAFARNSSSGALTQLAGAAGCVQHNAGGTGEDCTDGRGLVDAQETAVSPDCRSVYAVAENDNALTIFAREAASCTSTTPPPDEEEPPPPSDDPDPDPPSDSEDRFRDRDCDDFDSREEAQRFFERRGGPDEDRHNLDDDSDGRACESDPTATEPASAGGGDLPFTGMVLPLVAGAGLVFLSAGAALRRLAR